MSKLNKKSAIPKAHLPNVHLAGGMGAPAARQGGEQLLRRAVMTCLLWEDMAYEDGAANADNIAALIPQVDPKIVADIAIETRRKQKLRHVPLYIASEMAKHPRHKAYVERVLVEVITRPDQITDFMAIYWKKGKCPIAACIKRALAKIFNRFNEYSLAKYNRDAPIKLRDVMFMVHAKPETPEKEVLFKKLADNTLAVPDTWEVELSSGADKKATFTRLIEEGKLGSLAFIRNLRNMREAGVLYETMKKGFAGLAQAALLPLNFYSAYTTNPEYGREIEDAMFKVYADLPKLPGHTVYVVDVSGSMTSMVSAKSKFNRMQVAAALAAFAAETSERITVVATAGDYTHKSARVKPIRGFALADEIIKTQRELGGGGIFTAKCIEWLRTELKGEVPDRIIIFSDSQDCDSHGPKPKPFGKYNYIVDVSAHKHGVNYKGVWTAEISGWSESLLTFIRAHEGLENKLEEVVE